MIIVHLKSGEKVEINEKCTSKEILSVTHTDGFCRLFNYVFSCNEIVYGEVLE